MINKEMEPSLMHLSAGGDTLIRQKIVLKAENYTYG
jgi:hypothetical protein